MRNFKGLLKNSFKVSLVMLALFTITGTVSYTAEPIKIEENIDTSPFGQDSLKCIKFVENFNDGDSITFSYKDKTYSMWETRTSTFTKKGNIWECTASSNPESESGITYDATTNTINFVKDRYTKGETNGKFFEIKKNPNTGTSAGNAGTTPVDSSKLLKTDLSNLGDISPADLEKVKEKLTIGTGTIGGTKDAETVTGAAVKTYVEGKNYITKDVDDLANYTKTTDLATTYAKIADLDKKINKAEVERTYAKKAELTNKVNITDFVAEQTRVNDELDKKANINGDNLEKINKAKWVKALGLNNVATSVNLANKVDKVDFTAEQTRVNAELAKKIDKVEVAKDYAKKTELASKVDKTDFTAEQTRVNKELNKKIEKIYDITSETLTVSQVNLEENDVKIELKEKSIEKKYLKKELSNKIDEIDIKVNKDASNLEKNDKTKWIKALGLDNIATSVNLENKVDKETFIKEQTRVREDLDKKVDKETFKEELNKKADKKYVEEKIQAMGTVTETLSNEKTERIAEDKRLDERINETTALSSALASIEYPEINRGEVGVGAGISGYRGKTGVAVGVAYMPVDDMLLGVKYSGLTGNRYRGVISASASYKFRLHN